jgi:hypothetical protein
LKSFFNLVCGITLLLGRKFLNDSSRIVSQGIFDLRRMPKETAFEAVEDNEGLLYLEARRDDMDSIKELCCCGCWLYLLMLAVLQ